MADAVAFAVIGVVTGAVYAVAATGLVLTYTTANVFNMAHGATGMVMAFAYWELVARRGVPAAAALVLVIGLLAPATGVVMNRLLLRGVGEATVGTSMGMTLAVLLLLLGGAQALWPPTTTRLLPGLLPGVRVHVGGVVVTGHELATLATAAVVAGSLYLLLRHTRLGIAMRARVDDPDLLALSGVRPELVADAAWAVSTALAAVAGVLLAPALQLDHLLLTLLVVNAYAAAVVGRLSSLPLTFAGGLALGLVEAFGVRLLPGAGALAGLRGALPALLLFAVLLAFPRSRLEPARRRTRSTVAVPTVRMTVAGMAALVTAVAAIAPVLGAGDLARLSQGLVYATIMLSLVLVVGVSGQLSLCQLTFAGIGAVVAAALSGTSVPGAALAAPLVAAVAAGAAGVVVALPALRLHGLHLALATMAFAVLADRLLFGSLLEVGGSIVVQRPGLPGFAAVGDGPYLVLCAGAFALVAVAVVALRRSRFGVALVALRDSAAAAAMIGIDRTAARLATFAASAAIAGYGGALLAGLRGHVSGAEFGLLQSLPVLLVAVVAGATTTTGALLGGLLYAALPAVAERLPLLGGGVLLMVGASALALARHPDGLAGWVLRVPATLRDLVHRAPDVQPEVAGAAP